MNSEDIRLALIAQVTEDFGDDPRHVTFTHFPLHQADVPAFFVIVCGQRRIYILTQIGEEYFFSSCSEEEWENDRKEERTA